MIESVGADTVKKSYKHPRAVSPVLAVLMMIAVAVAGSLLVYAWFMGYIDLSTGRIEESIMIPSIANDPTNTNLIVYVQNIGDVAVQLEESDCLYVNGRLALCTISGVTVARDTATLKKGETATLTCRYGAAFPGEKIEVKVTTLLGNSAEATAYPAGTTYIPPVLDHFEFDPIASPQMSGVPFNVTVRALDQYGRLFAGYSGFNIFYSNATITVTDFGVGWSSGVMTYNVTVTGSATGVTIGTSVLSDASKNGTSNAFDVVGWLVGWDYRKSHVIENATGAGTGYQVPIVVNYGSGVDGGDTVYVDGKCQSDFDDIRFTDNDGVTELDYWIQEKTDSDNAAFWVEITDSLDSSNVTIYVYYQNSIVSTTSNGTETFPDGFDDFENNLSFWDYVDDDSGTVTLTSDYASEGNQSLRMYLTGYDISVRHLTTWEPDFAVGFSLRMEETTQRVSACPAIWFYPEETVVHVDAWEDGYFIYKYPTGWDIHTIMAYSADQWYQLEVRVTQGSAKFDLIIDGVEVVSDGEYQLDDPVPLPDNSDSIQLSMYEAQGICYFDGLYVRNYVALEPAHGDWGEEENWLSG